MAVINGTAKWTCVNHLNTEFDPNCWCVTLVLDDDGKEVLESQGLTTKDDNDGDTVFKFTRNELKKDGSPNKQPKCVDRDNILFEDKVGNGSKVRVQYRTYDWTFGKKSGTSADFMGLQVLELVEYGAKDGDEFDAVVDNVPF